MKKFVKLCLFIFGDTRDTESGNAWEGKGVLRPKNRCDWDQITLTLSRRSSKLLFQKLAVYHHHDHGFTDEETDEWWLWVHWRGDRRVVLSGDHSGASVPGGGLGDSTGRSSCLSVKGISSDIHGVQKLQSNGPHHQERLGSVSSERVWSTISGPSDDYGTCSRWCCLERRNRQSPGFSLQEVLLWHQTV